MAAGDDGRMSRGRDWSKDYDESDMAVLFERGDWSGWQDAVQWLHGPGMDDNELTPGEVNHMVEDLSRLDQQGVEFTADHHRAYQLAKSHRTHHS